VPGTLRISAEIRGADAALAVAAALDELAGVVSAFEANEAEAQWQVEAYPRAPVLDTALEIRLALLAAEAGGRLLRVIEERLPERDWLAENRRAFPPLRIVAASWLPSRSEALKAEYALKQRPRAGKVAFLAGCGTPLDADAF